MDSPPNLCISEFTDSDGPYCISATTHRAPSLAKRKTTDRPIPLPLPVTMATLSVNFMCILV